MKKKTSIIFFIIILITCITIKNKSTNFKKISNLTLNNIEAIASNEEKPEFSCYQLGDVDCYGIKVRLVVQDQSNSFFDFEDFY